MYGQSINALSLYGNMRLGMGYAIDGSAALELASFDLTLFNLVLFNLASEVWASKRIALRRRPYALWNSVR